MDKAFEVSNLTVQYDKIPVLLDVSFSIPKGKIVAILGPNGAGKSTLIKAAVGLVKPASGQFLFLGVPLKKARDLIAYVPQKETVDWDFPITVLEVVMMGRLNKLKYFRWFRKADYEAAHQALEIVQMGDFSKRQINELSGGQQQRVFLARALVQEAEIYLLDEPFAGVDASTEIVIISVLKKLRDKNKTLLIVHHDLHTVKEYFDQVVMLNHTLIAYGNVEDKFTQENLGQTYGKKRELLSEMIKLATVHKTGQI